MSSCVRQCPPVPASAAHQASFIQTAAFPLLYMTALPEYAAVRTSTQITHATPYPCMVFGSSLHLLPILYRRHYHIHTNCFVAAPLSPQSGHSKVDTFRSSLSAPDHKRHLVSSADSSARLLVPTSGPKRPAINSALGSLQT